MSEQKKDVRKGDNVHDGHRARMRKASELDPELVSFSDYQTLEFILSFLIPRKDTNKIAHDLIDIFGSLNAVFHASTTELRTVKNMTETAACFLSHFNAFMRKSEMSRHLPKPYMRKVTEAVEILRPYFYERNAERVYCAALDQNSRVLQIVFISEGLADIAELNNDRIFSLITRTKAKKVILAHNHPAGSLEPSDNDVALTQTLFTMLPTLGAVLSDHIIFSEYGYFSFYEEHVLDRFALNVDRIYGSNIFSEMRMRKTSGQYVLEPKMVQSESDEDNEAHQ